MKLKRFLSLLLTLCMMMSITQFPISAEEPSFSASGSVSMYVDSLHAYVTSSGVDSDGYTTYEVELPTDPTFDSNEYYANQLSGYQKQLYRAFMDGFCDIADSSLKLKQKVDVYYTTSVSVNVSSQEELEEFLYEKLDEEFEKIDGQTLYNAIQYDHTELFWMHGVALNIGAGIDYKSGVATIYWVVEMLVDASELYSSNASLISAARSMTTAVNNIVAAAPTTSEYDALVYFNNWLKENNTYNHPHLENGNYPLAHSSISALISKNSETKGPVCQGYAYAFKYLCDKVGIDCVVVSGDLWQTYADPGPHAWNAVELDGVWYGVDVTSTDSLGTDEYDFLVGSETRSCDPTYKTFATSHVIDNTHRYPTLSKTAYELPGKIDFTYTVKNNEVTITGYTGDKTDIVIPAEIEGYPVRHIGDNAFYQQFALTSVYIPEGIVSIGKNAFDFCQDVTEYNIPASVETIGEAAFAHNLYLSEINVDPNNANYTSVDGVLFNKDKTTLVAYPIGRMDASYTVPEGVKIIDAYAFEFTTELYEITLPSTLTTVRTMAFAHSMIEDVLYNGTKAQKANILIADQNTYLVNATWHYFDTVCGTTCSDCTLTRITTHSYDNDCDTVCNKCSETRTAPHYYTDECDGDCNECPETRTVPHSYDDDCDAYCNLCQNKRTPSHYFTNDCDSKCNRCNYTRASTHVYDNDCDGYCNLCGYARYDTQLTVTPVRSSAPYLDFTMDKTTDFGSSSKTTGFVTYEYVTSKDATPASPGYVVFDLGSLQTVNSLRLSWGIGEWGRATPDEYKVWVSSDDVTYTEVKHYVGLDAIINEGDQNTYPDSLTFTGGVAGMKEAVVYEKSLSLENVRYIKIEILDWTYRAALADVLVYSGKERHTYDNDQDDTCNICEEKRVIVIIIPGDVNGDGVVNNKDLGVLRRWLNEWDVEIDEEASDVNDDGSVNNKDLGLLRRYLNDWDVVLQ